ncbi:multicopper oxidase family protein [uncultured Paenibacillus sp.]|uniref:multicopper oxidase family protein n=1 Tax=uncultured Paenibacillus sp. TaxID=227322 RepID=UPI002803CFE9|nr:multicopper oxidase family protein [uncultured Paenibacillus sp.]
MIKKFWKHGSLAFLLLAASVFGSVGAANAEQAEPAKQDLNILTTTQLRKLPPLKETDIIVPTGKVKEFTLDVKEGKWELVKGTTVNAITINDTVPGPEIRVTEGDTVRITVKNNLKEDTSIHWHGLHIPNNMDGVPPFTQNGIKPGKSYTYEFIANHAGTFMYHSHLNSVEQIDKGFYGAFIIDPQKPEAQPKFDQDITWMLGGWNVDDMQVTGVNGTMSNKAGMDVEMPNAHGKMTDMAGMDMGMHTAEGTGSAQMNMDYNYWTINGKAFPDTKPLVVKKGETVRLRLINISNLNHPMHLHGHDFRVIAEDGHPISDPQVMNTIDVAPGKTYDIEFIADNPGTWVFHCHELHHTMNGEVEPGGLIGVIQYEGQPATVQTQSGME